MAKSTSIVNSLLLMTTLSCFIGATYAVELTFELLDNAKECFYEEITKNQSSILEFQVVTGGQYDVDVTLFDPNKEAIYSQQKQQFDSFQFNAKMTGIYAACFSNEFSTFSHKLVYMDFKVGEETPLPTLEEHHTAITQMESYAATIHKNLNAILDAQTHHRLRESQGRKRAEDINERVLWWAIIETFGVLSISICQVLVLRNFFTDRTPNSVPYTKM